MEETAELGEVTAQADRPGYEPISSTLWRQREEYCARMIQSAWRRQFRLSGLQAAVSRPHHRPDADGASASYLMPQRKSALAVSSSAAAAAAAALFAVQKRMEKTTKAAEAAMSMATFGKKDSKAECADKTVGDATTATKSGTIEATVILESER